MEQRVFPLITPERQQAYEKQTTQANSIDKTPMICGYYGRACRRMLDPKGACRMLCLQCPLAEYSATEEQRAQTQE